MTGAADPTEGAGFGAGFDTGVVRSPVISEQVSGRILAMIKSGNLRPGDKLPTEAQMGVAFGISRPPLREALKALTLMGVLESRQGGRYTVTDLSPARLVGPFNAMLWALDYDVVEHFEARALVDLHLVRVAALEASQGERARIVRLAEDGRQFHDDPVGFRLLDIEFHGALNAAARRPILAAMAQGLYDLGLDLRRVASTLPGVIPRSVRQHVAVADAIRRGDGEDAVAAYREHLKHVRDTTWEAIELRKGSANG